MCRKWLTKQKKAGKTAASHVSGFNLDKSFSTLSLQTFDVHQIMPQINSVNIFPATTLTARRQFIFIRLTFGLSSGLILAYQLEKVSGKI